MKVENLFDLLAEDLSREYSHWNFYIQSATSVVGLHREEIGEFLLEQAKEEMGHIEEFKRVLHGLNERRNLNKLIPTKISQFKNELSCPEQILKEALRMEDEVIRNYIQRIENACSLQENGEEDKVDGKYVELFLEDQVLDSRKDADHIRMMLKKI